MTTTNHTQPLGEDAANVAMLLTAEQKSALSQAADVMGANGFHWVEDTLRDLIAGANGAIGEREACNAAYAKQAANRRTDENDFGAGWEYAIEWMQARAALTAEKVAQAEPVAWRTKEFVMSRLQEAAKEPPSKRSVGNADRLAGDIWRTVLLSDLQEIVRHAAAPQSTQSPDGRVIDKAMVKRLAVQHGLLSVQTQVALTDEQRDNFDVRIKSAAEKHALDRTADGGWIFENHNLFNFAYAVTVAHPASGGES